MLGDFLARLAVALPLVCALAALSLLAVKRGWLSLPAVALPAFTRPGLSLPAFARPRPGTPAAAPVLDLVATKSLTPTARLAVVRFAGRDHLLAVSGQSLLLVASTPDPDAGELNLMQEPAPWTC